MAEPRQIVLEHADVGRVIRRMAHEIVEKCADPSELILVGIRSRGVHLARRLARSLADFGHGMPPVAAVDVTPFRDDRAEPAGALPVGEIPASVDEKIVVLVDDVIYRGRTIRAALEAIERLGRPSRVFVAVLVDRGSRELPIRADIVGKNVTAGEGQRVNVRLAESDGIDQVTVADWLGRGGI
jgi:pyrimidine operon attenuation protein/uracil phosphoribosyltransferase